MAEGTQTREELEANLKEYTEQLKQVEELLLMEENVNEELQEMYNSLTEVIQLTKDLIKEADDATTAAAIAAAKAELGETGPAAPHVQPAIPSQAPAAAPIVTPPALNLPGILPASVAEQIRKAQVRAALNGQAPAAWAIGATIQAQYTADGQWYNAVVEGVSASGLFIVSYEGYAEKEEVGLTAVRERPEAHEIYKGVAAPKRKRVEDAPVVTEIPNWLEIKEGDDEKTVARKKKLLKSYKSKIRFQNMDMKTKAKQDNWQNFVSGKGQKKKAGFFTGRKKESMFSVGEGLTAKVGVVGSGKGMTQYQKQRRIEGLPDADAE